GPRPHHNASGRPPDLAPQRGRGEDHPDHPRRRAAHHRRGRARLLRLRLRGRDRDRGRREGRRGRVHRRRHCRLEPGEEGRGRPGRPARALQAGRAVPRRLGLRPPLRGVGVEVRRAVLRRGRGVRLRGALAGQVRQGAEAGGAAAAADAAAGGAGGLPVPAPARRHQRGGRHRGDEGVRRRHPLADVRAGGRAERRHDGRRRGGAAGPRGGEGGAGGGAGAGCALDFGVKEMK
ncbi:hypothetical protein GGR56DRAFT_682855, partial [Xylariaceae sp. FL0804]